MGRSAVRLGRQCLHINSCFRAVVEVFDAALLFVRASLRENGARAYSCVMGVLDRNAMQDDDPMTPPTTNLIFIYIPSFVACVRESSV